MTVTRASNHRRHGLQPNSRPTGEPRSPRLRATSRIAALLLGMVASAVSAHAQDRVLGLLSLPGVFGRGACDRFTPRPVDLHATPQGRPLGSVVVVEPWTFNAGGCEGLEVGVRMAGDAAVQPFPTQEYGYEEPGAVVLERRDRWFRVRLSSGSAWLEASALDEFYSLDRLYEQSLTYLTDAWNRRLSASPGTADRAARHPIRTGGFPARVGRSSREHGELWFFVEILSHSGCDGNVEPTVADRGWVQAHGTSGEPSIWFRSRGC
jgi:hypothetical protein